MPRNNIVVTTNLHTATLKQKEKLLETLVKAHAQLLKSVTFRTSRATAILVLP